MKYPDMVYTCRRLWDGYADKFLRYYSIGGCRCEFLDDKGKCFHNRKKCKFILYKRVQ